MCIFMLHECIELFTPKQQVVLTLNFVSSQTEKARKFERSGLIKYIHR